LGGCQAAHPPLGFAASRKGSKEGRIAVDVEEPMLRDEYHRRETEVLFGIELLLYRWGLSEFVFDEEEEVFRNREGKVVLSRRHADRDRLLGH
jgi:hypothetical protein